MLWDSENPGLFYLVMALVAVHVLALGYGAVALISQNSKKPTPQEVFGASDFDPKRK